MRSVRPGSSRSIAATTCFIDGLTMASWPMKTVGTVSSPPVTCRTRSAADGSAWMSNSVVAIPRIRI